MIRFVLISSLILLCLQSVHSMSCGYCSRDACPPPPTCLYGTSFPPCGCCPICSNGPSENCGGPWGEAGECGTGLTCQLPPEDGYRSHFATGVCVRSNRYKRAIGGLGRRIGKKQAMKAVHSHNAYGGISPEVKARIAAYMKSLGKV